MSWYRTGTVVVTNGSKTVTGVGTLFTTAVNVGDAFSLVDANLNPTGAWYEVDVVVSNTELTLKQSYAGSTGSNNQYCVFNMVGNMTTPSFAQRLATFFASFQSLIDKPTTTPTAASIPVADANGDIDSGWLKDASATVKGVVELATSAEVLAGTDTERGITPATLTAKILGTVSETDGVPTGAVIESGSNANGKYVKFADGTMICTHVITWTNPSLSQAFTFPAAFSEYPAVGMTSQTSWDDTINVVAAIANTSSILITVYIVTSGSVSRRTTSIEFQYTAIGRWF